MPNEKKEKDDADTVYFEVGKDDRSPPQEWRVGVKCSSGLSEQEFAVSLQSLAEDILAGKVDFDTAPDVVSNPDVH